jgi:Transposase, Mutator family
MATVSERATDLSIQQLIDSKIGTFWSSIGFLKGAVVSYCKRYFKHFIVARSEAKCTHFVCASVNNVKGWKDDGKSCQFHVYARKANSKEIEKDSSISSDHFKITSINLLHTCKECNRKRNYDTSTLELSFSSVDDYLPPCKAKGGGAKQLRKTAQAANGLKIEESHSFKIVSNKTDSSVPKHIGQYYLLQSFFESRKVLDPHGTYILETQYCYWNSNIRQNIHLPQFKRYYIASSTMKHLWTHGLRLMVSDGTFTTSGFFKHVILLAVTFDGNNQLCIVAFAVVAIEDNDNWLWFLSKLVVDFQGIEVFIADYSKGIEAAYFQDTLMEVGAKFCRCARHLAANCAAAKGMVGVTQEIKDMLIGLAKYRTVDTYNSNLQSLKAVHSKAAAWIDCNKDDFAAYIFLDNGKRRFGKVLSNAAENMNSAIKEMRELPILDFTVSIIRWVNTKVSERNTNACKRENMLLTEHAETELLELCREGQKLEVYMMNHVGCICKAEVKHEVRGSDARSVVVLIDTAKHSCVCPCRHAEEFGYPCKHGFAVICYLNLDPNNPAWFNEVFHMKSYRAMYNILIPDTTTLGHLSVRELVPPNFRRLPGRPQTKRYVSKSENPHTCSFCGVKEHSYLTCTTPSTEYIYNGYKKKAMEYGSKQTSLDSYASK